jgi:hypothetical protein
MKKILALGIIALLAVGGMATLATATHMDGSSGNNRMQKGLRQQDGTCDTPGDGNKGTENGGNGNGDGNGDGDCDNLTTMTGMWSTDGTWYYLDGIRLHVGPNWYISRADSAHDYDGDGITETIVDELDGLVDSEVTVQGALHEGALEWFSVFSINDMLYREEGRPIWAGGQH